MRRLLFGLALFLLPGVGWGDDFIRYTAPGNPYSAQLLLSNGTAAAPALAFSSQPALGIFKPGADIISFGDTAEFVRFNAAAGFVVIPNNYAYAWSSNGVASGTPDMYLYRGSFQGGPSKALTDAAAATPYAVVAIATNGWIAGELLWVATSVSGADQLTTTGSVRFAGADTAGTPVCTISPILSGVAGTEVQSLSAVSGGANTLVCTWTNVVSTTNCALSVTCTNDLAGAQAITLRARLNMPSAVTSIAFP